MQSSARRRLSSRPPRNCCPACDSGHSEPRAVSARPRSCPRRSASPGQRRGARPTLASSAFVLVSMPWAAELRGSTATALFAFWKASVYCFSRAASVLLLVHLGQRRFGPCPDTRRQASPDPATCRRAACARSDRWDRCAPPSAGKRTGRSCRHPCVWALRGCGWRPSDWPAEACSCSCRSARGTAAPARWSGSKLRATLK